MDKTYYLGYAYCVTQEGINKFCFTVYHISGNICDGGYSKTNSGAVRKAQKLIKLFNSY